MFLNVPQYSSTFLNIPQCSSIFLNVPQYSSMFLNIPQYSSIFLNVPQELASEAQRRWIDKFQKELTVDDVSITIVWIVPTSETYPGIHYFVDNRNAGRFTQRSLNVHSTFPE
jgi:hypothetical protein